MHYLTAWFIRNPVAANLMMMFILFLGAITVNTMRIEGFPRVPPDSIIITTTLQNAPATQMDEQVTQKIEKALEGLEGVKSLSAQSDNEVSIVTVRKAGGQDLNKLLDKVRLRIDGVTELPQSVKRPIIDTTGFDFPALYVNLYGNTDPRTLQKLSERLREELLEQPELSRLKIWGLHEREMRIEVDPKILQQYDLTVADIVEKVRASSLDFQAGTLRTASGSVYLRADNMAKFSKEFAEIPVIETANGIRVLLSDVAQINDSFHEGEYLFRFNGYPTTGMEVLVGHKENLLQISQVVNQVVDSFQHQTPANVKVVVWGDSSEYISDRLELLRSNGVQGLILVIIMLSLFLNVRLAFWVAMGIPISIMGALAVAGSQWFDYSLNDVTTFGLIIALGILVDDAVVVGESVFDERRKIADPIRGTEAGVSRVSIATVFGVLTTIAAFYPMMLIDNPLGKVLAGFSGIVIFALSFSLLESKFILPAHLAAIDLNQTDQHFLARFWIKVQGVAQAGLLGFRDRIYAPILSTSLHHRYAVLLLFVSAAMLGLGMIGLGKIKTVFFPDVPGQVVTINLEMDARAPFDLTRFNIEKIHQIGEQLNTDLQKRYQMEKAPIHAMFMIISSAESAQIYAELIPVAERPEVGILEIIREWRDITGELEGTTELEFSGSEELAGGFQLKLLSKDRDLLAQVSEEVKRFINKIDGVHNVRDTLAGGQPELEVRVKPEARSLGFTPESLALQIGYSYGGAEVQKVRRDGKELRVLILNSKLERDSLYDLLHSQLRSEKGDWIPFSSVAEVKGGYASKTLYRERGKTVSMVSASIDRKVVAPEEVSQAVFERLVPRLQQMYPSVQIKKAGELEEMGEIRGGLLKALLVAAVLIYVLMAVPLKSYWQPFIILAIVPFAFIAAAIGHLIMDLPLSLLSFFGMLALTGVVINDSLVLVTRYNQMRREGVAPEQALQQASISRFRAIFLTTATTVIGLTPLLMETSEQAQYLIPAAVSLAFGELFSTALMLLLVPVLIAIVGDLKKMS